MTPYAVPASTISRRRRSHYLAFTEHNFGLPPLEQNDASAYPLTAMFNLSAAHRALRPRMVTQPVPKGDRIQWWEARQDT